MANIKEPNEEQRSEWRRWVSERPANVRAVAERFEPWRLYRYIPKGEETGSRVLVIGFDETEAGPVTVRVLVSGLFNFVIFERQVFGVDPDDLTECDLPATDELLGCVIPS